jgi:hypothetical protein
MRYRLGSIAAILLWEAVPGTWAALPVRPGSNRCSLDRSRSKSWSRSPRHLSSAQKSSSTLSETCHPRSVSTVSEHCPPIRIRQGSDRRSLNCLRRPSQRRELFPYCRVPVTLGDSVFRRQISSAEQRRAGEGSGAFYNMVSAAVSE